MFTIEERTDGGIRLLSFPRAGKVIAWSWEEAEAYLNGIERLAEGREEGEDPSPGAAVA
jgi:hypothetical protein